MKWREIRYYIDPASGQPHIYEHGVDESEVEQILARPLVEEPSWNQSRVAVGRTVEGRFLKVVYAVDSEGFGLFVITAYDLRGKALAALRRRLRR